MTNHQIAEESQEHGQSDDITKAAITTGEYVGQASGYSSSLGGDHHQSTLRSFARRV